MMLLKSQTVHKPTTRETASGKVVPIRGFTEGHPDANPQDRRSAQRESRLDKPVLSTKVSEIATRPDLMQFKLMENADGTNGHDAIKGKWNDLYAGIITIWKPENPKQYGLKRGERYIVVNGHHRLAHAKRFGVQNMRVQVLYEGKGPDPQTSNVTPLAARRIGAEINIVDGKGTIYDQVKFLRDQRAVVGKDRSLERAREIGIAGGTAAAIGFNAKDSLAAAFFSEKVTPEQALMIATSAPGDDDVQRLGIKKALKGKSGPMLYHYIQAIKALMRNKQEAEQMDLFGGSDSAINEATDMAERAARIQRQIKDRINAVQGAASKPDKARELGVNVEDPEATMREVKKLKQERDKWDKWYLYPTLIAQARALQKSLTPGLYLLKSRVKAHVSHSASGKSFLVSEHEAALHGKGGYFREKDHGRWFEYHPVTDKDPWHKGHGATHMVTTGQHFDGSDRKLGAIVKKTRAHVMVDEGSDGKPVWETWHFRKNEPFEKSRPFGSRRSTNQAVLAKAMTEMYRAFAAHL